ncbi:hypothetical protein [Paeniglutamicibacter sp. NPDC091659]|uniref:hypothetical protein n=1 Tax=Paeniglutamicibacter sp. NPDC091659 TaxID=3364389 RepID=UPI00380B8907
MGTLVPQPYVPGLSEGQGQDLCGIALIFGSWIGGILATLPTVAIPGFVHRNTIRPSDGHIPNTGQQ